MRIKLSDFGTILTSRPAGRDAALSLLAYKRPVGDEPVELDFEGVLSVGPSWLAEVLAALRKEYGAARVKCLPSTNPTVIESLKVIDAEI